MVLPLFIICLIPALRMTVGRAVLDTVTQRRVYWKHFDIRLRHDCRHRVVTGGILMKNQGLILAASLMMAAYPLLKADAELYEKANH
jgi:hypothetical protein